MLDLECTSSDMVYIEQRNTSCLRWKEQTMKVLLLNGSPHGKGCTYTALNEVAETLIMKE